MALKYKVGDRVRIKDLTWYDKNKSNRDIISFPYEVEIVFTLKMSSLCGHIVTISKTGYTNGIGFYRIREDNGVHRWTDEMIEGLVGEETKFGIVSNPIESKSNANSITQNEVDVIEKAKTYWDSIKDAWICPEGYQFVDEDGNVINVRKIVLEKKKKEYPKTHEECAEIITELTGSDCNPKGCMGYMSTQLTVLQKLLICRDAYWKLYGEEMGLSKPWEPDWTDFDQLKHCIWVDAGEIVTTTNVRGQHILAFPTAKMRDAFYENFKELIEECKELL